MNDILQLRVWKKDDKKIYNVEGFNINGNYMFPNEPVYFLEGNVVSKVSDCITMRYTGLKDSNGKKIYEGDIIFDRKYCPCYAKVVFCNIEEYLYNSAFRCWALINEYGTEEFLDIKALDKYEVIGNIYERPELMEVENE